MEPARVFQTKFGAGNGNCLQAAVASLLRMDIDEVPDFISDENDEYNKNGINWFGNLYSWVLSIGKGMIVVGDNDCFLLNVYGIAILEVKDVPDENHAVVMKYTLESVTPERWNWRGDVFHDPNPNSLNLTKIVHHIFIF